VIACLICSYGASASKLPRTEIGIGGHGVAPLRVLPMESSDEVTFVDGVAPLPSGFLDKRALYISNRPEALSYEPPSVFHAMTYDRRGLSYPVSYTIEGNSIKIAPAVNVTANLLYYRRLVTPEDTEAVRDRFTSILYDRDGDDVTRRSVTTNDILTRYPGVYLFGTQVELYRTLRNPDEMQVALRMYADAVQAANSQAMLARTFGGPVRKRLMGLGV
jgi:hypothetical protein